MAIELRGGVRACAVVGDTVFERQAGRFLPDIRSRPVCPFDIQQKARLEEADGLDSALVTVASAWPDPWLVAGYALSSTSTLRITVAHRPGVTQPTVAARSLATLDRLSQGRTAVHVVIGSSDADVRRDGDFADKEQRYRRAFEYLEIFTRALESCEPFDYAGEFYRLEDAGSGFLPVQQPRPPLSIGGSSEHAQRLAARFADIYAGTFDSLENTQRLKAKLQALADGRTLKLWKHFQVILGDTEQAAQDTARQWRETALGLLLARPAAELSASPQMARDHERQLLTQTRPAQRQEWAQAVVQRAFDGVWVGTADKVAAEILAYHQAGIDIVQLEATTESAQDIQLRRQLIERLRGAP
ncbi:LLM class flavin-dependent oxidoreductase [Pseudomonas sp. 13B_2.1_Bac1]|uniref:LLM class flavin-dependent oxidoreductase n=1 Tax=Pseudomonas sp. 13B_2.1_Bac1 TaxID=2971624 RepID=UPI0021C985F5|nr:LLM class flavin-dependent oxidoreductase [Pseudomonas sp. 13B_2.1_Bac1]MCU1785260.1 LLM class flavin-dependent oxidoreductase [Pseudomonas sp. 13B_2.1_Bac1]